MLSSITVTRRFPPWASILTLVVLCAALTGAFLYWRSRSDSTASLLARLPTDGVVAFVDFAALRRAGVLDQLAAPAAIQEAEYRSFVEGTGFDYTKHLDSALISFHPRGTYLLLRGRFDWKRLAAYAERQGGNCYSAFCRAPGSAEERRISFFPVHPGLMGLAVSRDDWAALALNTERRSGAPWEIPDGVAWSIIPAAVLKDPSRLPAGTHAFARPLQDASRIAFSLGVSNGRLGLELDVTCGSPDAAAALASELRSTTERLRSLIVRENQTPNPRDLSGVLTMGVFERKGNRVIGRWPIERELLESLTRSLP